ncbi:MAG: cation transporting ATPase C-terminal domain-containing protein, partial [Runella zeae]
KYLIGAIVLGFLLQIVLLEVPFLAQAFKLQPLHLRSWLEIIGLGIFPLVLNEVFKLFKKISK